MLVLTPQVTMVIQVNLAHYGPWAADVVVLKLHQERDIQADQAVALADMLANLVVLALLVKDLAVVLVLVLEKAAAVALAEPVAMDIMVMAVMANFFRNLHQ